ncbi:uncharacterized protein LOC131851789 [Achroia grisella]|uniref:uncharacterized protein LOC131851789 n=1 Tax=Achroia grisella TaxID=688607 RepID=UPI0027D28682|nr:uncharacterized protein LOC131851789 [Achroia grisella]
MRRGHPGIGGWRNENTRHFRPRSGGTPHYRPPATYGLLDLPRFPPPTPRPHRSVTPFSIQPGSLNNQYRYDIHKRNKYKDNRQNNQRDNVQLDQRSNHPHHQQHMRHNDSSTLSTPYEFNNLYENQPINNYVNNRGDVDHRQYGINHTCQDPYKQNRVFPWTNPSNNINVNYDDNRGQYNNRQLVRQESIDGNKLPLSEYTGHRPPASDHYDGKPSSDIDNSNSFSHSVDDTIDIVRKRLMNRNEPHQENPIKPNNQTPQSTQLGDNTTLDYHTEQDPPAKKRIQRQRSTDSRKCEKIKDKIVHQLFKMDKDRIHKLMDDPSSSTKFEYAISSLITESQISLNRHMRSVAEQSLCSSSDFINNDTVYEDTFMKQMQCILEPQDTIFLEDIKPLVMAELSKVLQLDNEDQRFDISADQGNYPSQDFNPNCEQYYNNSLTYDNMYQDNNYEKRNQQSTFDKLPDTKIKIDTDTSNDYNQIRANSSNPLFERRRHRRSNDHEKNKLNIVNQRSSRRSMDEKGSNENILTNDAPVPNNTRRSIDSKPCNDNHIKSEFPIFQTNTELFSGDDDTFAELDQQYHVAVDPNFIESYDNLSPPRSHEPNVSSEINCQTPDKSIKEKIDSPSQSIESTPIKQPSCIKKDFKTECQIKKEIMTTPIKTTDTNENIAVQNDNLKQEHTPQQKKLEGELGKSENTGTLIKSSTPTTSRKRSLDQKPSHRKEKRKKSDSSLLDANKQILNKNIIINVNDCAAKKTEKCKEAKSIFNLFFSKDEHNKESLKESKKSESIDKHYSDKYVKRKEEPKTSKSIQNENKKKHHTNSSNSSNISPKSVTDTTNTKHTSQTTKSDSKVKLKHIDMFVEQPRKISVHQAHRNTTTLPPTTVPEKSIETNKIKVHTNNKVTKSASAKAHGLKKLVSKETQTVVSKACTTRFCQTERKKTFAKAIQTEPVIFDKSRPKATDAFERMKEIDLEIQVLLQEKFKLYNSLESRDPSQNVMQTLGMTVVNMSPSEEDKDTDAHDNASLSEDTIVDDFTNIPVEELEQIALESVRVAQIEPIKVGKRSRRQKKLAPDIISTSNKRYVKKIKTPNISLIEQIITDDRPLEDIISLDDLESVPSKSRKKTLKQRNCNVPKKKVTKKVGTSKSACNTQLKLKECSVVLVNVDVSKYLSNMIEEPNHNGELVHKVDLSDVESIVVKDEVKIEVDNKEKTNIIEDINDDLHFDMLDVSEDIVIGDNCEFKSTEGKDTTNRIVDAINEEIILDNSQSSMEEATNPDGAQEENECKMYDYSTDENLQRDSLLVTGNADAILAIECIDKNFLAAGLDGNVYYFGGDGQLISTLRGSNLAVTCLTIVKDKYETTVYTGSLDSRIRYYDLETGLEKGPECNVLSPIQTMDRAWDTIFVGTRTGFVLQFECKNNMLIPVSTVKFSEQSILALRAMKEGPRKVLLVAARSEDVTIKDAQTGLLLRTLVGPKMTVYTLLYEDGKVYCGTSSHQIHVFDYASGTHASVHEGGKGAVCLRASGGLLFAGCYDGCVYVYREGEPQPLAQLRGPSLMLLSLAVVDTKIIAGYKDRSLYIWKIPLSIVQEMIL